MRWFFSFNCTGTELRNFAPSHTSPPIFLIFWGLVLLSCPGWEELLILFPPPGLLKWQACAIFATSSCGSLISVIHQDFGGWVKQTWVGHGVHTLIQPLGRQTLEKGILFWAFCCCLYVCVLFCSDFLKIWYYKEASHSGHTLWLTSPRQGIELVSEDTGPSSFNTRHKACAGLERKHFGS